MIGKKKALQGQIFNCSAPTTGIILLKELSRPLGTEDRDRQLRNAQHIFLCKTYLWLWLHVLQSLWLAKVNRKSPPCQRKVISIIPSVGNCNKIYYCTCVLLPLLTARTKAAGMLRDYFYPSASESSNCPVLWFLLQHSKSDIHIAA